DGDLRLGGQAAPDDAPARHVGGGLGQGVGAVGGQDGGVARQGHQAVGAAVVGDGQQRVVPAGRVAGLGDGGEEHGAAVGVGRGLADGVGQGVVRRGRPQGGLEQGRVGQRADLAGAGRQPGAVLGVQGAALEGQGQAGALVGPAVGEGGGG